MVAISLYRGDLHKVPDVPRRWLVATPSISPKDFKILIRRRERARSRLRSAASGPNPNLEFSTDTDSTDSEDGLGNNCDVNHVDSPPSEPKFQPAGDLKEGKAEDKKAVEAVGEVKNGKLVEGDDSLRKLVEKTDAVVVEEKKNEENVKNDDKTDVILNPVVEKTNTEDATSDVEERKKEVKEKLVILNEKKHSLVQVLKQILNAEEQLKRRNSTQGISGRPPLPLQVDTTTDSGSMTKVNTPRIGSDGIPCGGIIEGGGEADDVSNPNVHSRHLQRMSSTSPSSDSQQRKLASNMVPHTYRTTLVVAGSPSRFAPAAGPGHSSVSVSGTSYIASSPSPAASGGTSVFRDARLPSPWN